MANPYKTLTVKLEQSLALSEQHSSAKFSCAELHLKFNVFLLGHKIFALCSAWGEGRSLSRSWQTPEEMRELSFFVSHAKSKE